MRLISSVRFSRAAVAAAAFLVATGFGGTSRTDEFRPQTVIQRPFPAITQPSVMTAEQAASRIKPSELVLGVAVGDEARAYPINMLTGPSREIINDTLGGTAIAATW